MRTTTCLPAAEASKLIPLRERARVPEPEPQPQSREAPAPSGRRERISGHHLRRHVVA